MEMQQLVYVKIQFDSVNIKLKYIVMKHKWQRNQNQSGCLYN